MESGLLSLILSLPFCCSLPLPPRCVYINTLLLLRSTFFSELLLLFTGIVATYMPGTGLLFSTSSFIIFYLARYYYQSWFEGTDPPSTNSNFANPEPRNRHP